MRPDDDMELRLVVPAVLLSVKLNALIFSATDPGLLPRLVNVSVMVPAPVTISACAGVPLLVMNETMLARAEAIENVSSEATASARSLGEAFIVVPTFLVAAASGPPFQVTVHNRLTAHRGLH